MIWFDDAQLCTLGDVVTEEECLCASQIFARLIGADTIALEEQGQAHMALAGGSSDKILEEETFLCESTAATRDTR